MKEILEKISLGKNFQSDWIKFTFRGKKLTVSDWVFTKNYSVLDNNLEDIKINFNI